MVNSYDLNDKVNQIWCNKTNTSDVSSTQENGGKHYLNYEQEDQMEIIGYEQSLLKNYLTWFFYILTCGILRLVFHWYPHWGLKATHWKCDIDKAEKILIIEKILGKYKTFMVTKVISLSIKEEGDIEQKYNNNFMTICLDNGSKKDMNEIKAIWCKNLCYVWDEDKFKFFKLVGLDTNIPNSVLHKYKGYSRSQQRIQRIAYGYNEINVPVDNILTLVLLEILTPFYIFQIYAIILWTVEAYYYYNIAIITMSIFGISSSVYQTRINQINLRKTVQSSDKVKVLREKTPQTHEDIVENIDSSELVPGDIIFIPNNGCILQSDCILLDGGTCIVNESMLTGESVPVTKTPLPNTDKKIYNLKNDSNHTLYGGTKVIQTRQYGTEEVRAVVIRTGFLTAKGQLVRSILYPPPVDFKFDRDSYKFIVILTIVAIGGLLYTIIYKSARGMYFADILIKSLDLLTICIPPALPAAMTVGKIYALGRLKKEKIFCMNSRMINISGSINCVCFDKTGTLTEDGLDVWGVIPVKSSTNNATKSELDLPILQPGNDLSDNSDLLLGMVTCHSLTVIDGEMNGDPLDVKMFESTKWLMEEVHGSNQKRQENRINIQAVFKSPKNEMEIDVIHQFQFSSDLRCMSVITKKPNDKYCTVYCKGSPEKIIELCKPETVPENILKELDKYTRDGYRVIGLAAKVLSDENYEKVNLLQREDFEYDLHFAGILILENRLKPVTTSVIDVLKKANMKIVMITGDNIKTAVSVAQECGIIEPNQRIIDININDSEKMNKNFIFKYHETDNDQLINNSKIHDNVCQDIEFGKINFTYVLTGAVWKTIKEDFPDQLPYFAKNGSVFARMSSDQKKQLILELQNLGYYVAMCGDGANDCGALKAAHAGISLSDTEASVASPFTSKEANIACVPKVIREGRAALITSFGIFKFMVAYSLLEFASTIILYGFDVNLTDFQFLYIDIVLIINFAFFFGKTEAFQGALFNRPPVTSLLSLEQLTSLILQMFSYVAFLIVSLYVVMQYKWFVPHEYDPNNINNFASFENYAVFAVSVFQYIIMAIAFSFGKPYRQPIYTNYQFIFSIFITILLNIYLVICPNNWIIDLFQMKLPPMEFRTVTLLLAVCNFVVASVFEDFIVNILIHKLILNRETNNGRQDLLSRLPMMGVDNITFIDENEKSIHSTITSTV